MSGRTIIFLLLIFWLSLPSLAHEKHHHGSEGNKADPPATDDSSLKIIKLSYERDIEPIFTAKCMNCHSNTTNYPFYYNWPFAKKLIDDDIAESRKHLDMSNGFPFKGHGTLADDLEAIKKASSEGTMPPLRYRLMHWGSSLTMNEKQAISNWVEQSLKVLQDLK